MVSNPMLRRSLDTLAAAVLLLAIALPARAAARCPWMNDATASGLLGGDAVGNYVDRPAACTFTQTGNGVTRTLTVSVFDSPKPHDLVESLLRDCEQASPVQAIGNEAAVCTAGHSKYLRPNRLIGRVRGQVFVIAFDTTLRSDPILNNESISAKIDIAAEQIAGNLF